MNRFACLLALVPTLALAQTPASTAKPTTTTPAQAKPAAPATRTAPRPAPAASAATRKPAPAAPATATTKPTPTASALTTDEQKTIYAIGLLMQRSLAQFDLTPAELDIVTRAIADASAGKPAVVLDEWGPAIDPLVRARRARVAERVKVESTAYLAKAATAAGALVTASGLIYREVAPGTGASPSAEDTVRVHYRGTLTNGTEFDSSLGQPQPAEFRLRGVIPCWTEGVQRMRVGGKAQLVCPSSIAYGDAGNPSIPGGAALIFDIELVGIAPRP